MAMLLFYCFIKSANTLLDMFSYFCFFNCFCYYGCLVVFALFVKPSYKNQIVVRGQWRRLPWNFVLKTDFDLTFLFYISIGILIITYFPMWTVPNKATVILQPNWPLIYRGETVTVRCEIQGGGDTKWTYEWTPANLITSPTLSEHRINSNNYYSGEFKCRGRKDSYSSTEWSDVITLTVLCKLDIFHP